MNNIVPCFFQAVVTLDVGATFGESIVHDLPRDMTVCTKTTCELLRIHQNDFKKIWDVSDTFKIITTYHPYFYLCNTAHRIGNCGTALLFFNYIVS